MPRFGWYTGAKANRAEQQNLTGGHQMKKTLKTATLGFLAGTSIFASWASSAIAEPSEAYKVTTVAEGLDHPWCLAFLPDGSMLVTERGGRLSYVRDGKLDPKNIEGVPEPYVRSQGGLFDVVLHPDFANNNTIYLTYAGGDRGSNATHVARGQLNGYSIDKLEVIFAVDRKKDTPVHYGGRMMFLPDGTFLLTTGDGFDFREQAQILSNHLGVVVRLNDDGGVPDDNPFVGQADAKPEIWSFGHRNPQGIAIFESTGVVYTHEHGPRGGDELNLMKPGANYGWPAITYGLDYSGARISPFTELKGMEQPDVYWVPSIGPSGLAAYEGDQFPNWKGDLFVGALVEKSVRRVDLENGKVLEEEILFQELDHRIRDVRAGPDGYLYLLTDETDGEILRIEPSDDSPST
jgi:glucose/arabinose dehydrogenase